MEAIGKHKFDASMDDELSFNKGDALKVMTGDLDQNWYKAEMNGKEGFVPCNYIQMCPHDWYKCKLGRGDADRMLLDDNQPDGAFLLRPSESSPGDFSLSVKWANGVQHFKVLRDGTGKYFLWVVKFNSLNELVEYHRTSSVSRTQTIMLRDMVGKSSLCKVEAMYDFEAQEKEELSFKKGDLIRIIEKPDTHWWKGVGQDGATGLLPCTYVKESG